MAKRLSDTEIWDKEWFMKLPPRLKCAVKYIRDKCDLIGLWKPNWELANSQIKGDKELTESELLSIDAGNQFKKVGEKIACIDFIRFQYGETLSDKSPIHKKVFAMLQKGGYSIDTLSNRVVGRVVDTPQEEVKEKEEDKDMVMVKEKVTKIDDDFEKFQEWTTLILNRQDPQFEQMLMAQKKDYNDEVINSHLALLSRYPKMRPETQQKFRISLLGHYSNNGNSGSSKKKEKDMPPTFAAPVKN